MPFNSQDENQNSGSAAKKAEVTRFMNDVSTDDVLAADFELSDSQSGLGLSVPIAVLGEYLLLERIGSGGMGDVYRAEHRTMNRQVALKILNQSIAGKPVVIRRFFEEIRAVARMMHPNIVTAFDAGTHQGTHFLVMELVDGQLLSRRVAEVGLFSMHEAVSVLFQAARALEYAHSQGIIHRDIKPGNMMLTHDGTLKILDFGLARLEQSGTRAAGKKVFMGTVEYMSPEQVEDAEQVDARSDLYSLGATLFYLVTGQPMFRGEQMQVARSQVRDKPPALYDMRSDIDLRLDAVFQRLVAKSPIDRIPTARALLDVIEQLNLHPPDSATHELAKFPHHMRSSSEQSTSFASSYSTIAKSMTAIGIDLGMVSSTVAFFDPLTGPRVVVQPGGGEHLRNMLWSNQDQIVVGTEAANLRQAQPEKIFHSLQRWIGLKQIERPFGGKLVPPEILLATVLRKLLDSVHSTLPGESHAVVTVPGCYDQLHRAAIQNASQVAGIEVLQLLDKSLATALAWIDLNSRISTLNATDLRSNPTLLVVHLGGSGLEASVIQMQGLTAHLRSTSGNPKLGTLRWQNRLAEYYAELIQQKTGQNIKEDVGAATRLQRTVEMALDRLGKSSRVDVRFDWRQQSIQEPLTQKKLVELAPTLLDSIRTSILTALVDAQVEASSINQVLLVGSLVAIEPIEQVIRSLLPHEVPISRMHKSDLARGAALHAQQLIPFNASSVATPRAVGCTTFDIGLLILHPVTRKPQPHILITRGTPLPTINQRTLRPIGQDARFALQIIEGTSVDPSTWHKLGSMDAATMFPERQLDQPLQLQLTVDESGVLSTTLNWPAGKQRVAVSALSDSSILPESVESWRVWLTNTLNFSDNAVHSVADPGKSTQT